MKEDKHNLPKRRSIRFCGYDYSQEGLYFVTVCTKDKICLFGNIIDEEMMLNEAGKMIEKWFYEIENKFHDIRCLERVIMPNHIHFILLNSGTHVGADLCVCPDKTGEHTGSPLHNVIQWFKTMTTNEYIRGVKENNWIPFNGKLWQRNYYEHIIRNNESYQKITEYIYENPRNWRTDDYYNS